MKKVLWWLLVVVTLLLPLPASAQAGVSIDRMEVDIWPEYDKPEVLVIYHIFLPADTVFPAEINLRIPAQAGDPYNVAVRNTDGNLYVVDFTRAVDNEWAVVTFSTPQPEIQFEYYDPSLLKDSTQRSFIYRWPGDYAVNNLSIQVQQPVGASEMQISPSLGAGLSGTDGLVYFNAQVGAVPADNPFEVSMKYQKSDDSLSVQTVRVEPAGAITEDTAGRFDFTKYIPWLLAAVGLILLAGGGLWYYQSTHRPAPAPSRRRHQAASKRQADIEDDTDIYCHKCGRRASQGDRFCRTCGTELRV